MAKTCAIGEEAALLMRLQEQFGDIDISAMMTESKPCEGDHAFECTSEEEEESSLEEPSPEELRAWQDAQFKTAKKRVGGENSEMTVEVLEGGPPYLEEGEESAFFVEKEEDCLLVQLAEVDPDVFGGKWKRLYSSNQDGLSYCSLMRMLQGYTGPTVLILGTVPSSTNFQSKDRGINGILGFYTATPWRESGDAFYGTNDSFLFSLDSSNHLQIYRPTGKNKNFMSTNTTTPTNKSPKRPGIHIGSSSSSYNPRLHITESLQACRALPHGDTFQPGLLLPWVGGCFNVDVMEAWGVGGTAKIRLAHNTWRKARNAKDACKRRSQTVDRRQFLDHFKTNVLGKAFAHHTYSNSN